MVQPGAVRLVRTESGLVAPDAELGAFDIGPTGAARKAVAANVINTRAPGRIIAEA
jgi:hypothetical protein